jgi:ferredoxin
MQGPSDFELSRRKLLLGTAASVAFSAAPPMANAQAPAVSTQEAAPEAVSMSKVSFNVNGSARQVALDTRTTLLDALREHLHLNGSKKGCDHGQCGACTVIVGDVGSILSQPGGDARRVTRSRHRGGWARLTTCTRCRPPSSSMTVFSAAIARRADLLGGCRAG